MPEPKFSKILHINVGASGGSIEDLILALNETIKDLKAGYLRNISAKRGASYTYAVTRNIGTDPLAAATGFAELEKAAKAALASAGPETADQKNANTNP